jgi:primosomal protein N''
MSPPSQDPSQLSPDAEISAWIHTATLKCMQLQLHAEDSASDVREQAFQEMGELCQAAIEEVRMVSTQLHEESVAARHRSAELLAESVRLLARYTALSESQLLRIFTRGNGPAAG